MNELDGIIGLGVIIRDSSGFVLASCSLSMAGCFDANLAEIIAIYKGLMCSRAMGWRRVYSSLMQLLRLTG